MRAGGHVFCNSIFQQRGTLVRASIIIAAHNEGKSLWKTIRSCVESIGKLDYEIVIADDNGDMDVVFSAFDSGQFHDISPKIDFRAIIDLLSPSKKATLNRTQ